MSSAPTAYKKRNGTLSVGADRTSLFWTPSEPPSSPPSLTIAIKDITSQSMYPGHLWIIADHTRPAANPCRKPQGRSESGRFASRRRRTREPRLLLYLCSSTSRTRSHYRHPTKCNRCNQDCRTPQACASIRTGPRCVRSFSSHGYGPGCLIGCQDERELV